MSPRPAADPHDETALLFLDAGAGLIDAMLQPERDAPLPPRLRQLHYPAPLDWIRIEDVLRLVGDSAHAGRKAFYNRWPTKDDYIRDVFVHTLLYRDRGGKPLASAAVLQAHLVDPSLPIPDRIRNVARGMAAGLLTDPRAFLLSHAAVMVTHDPETARLVTRATERERDLWRETYRTMLAGAGVDLRPGWTLDSAMVVIQMLMDGMVMGYRVAVPESMREVQAMGTALGDALVAFLGSIVDWERTGLPIDEWIVSRADASS